MRVQEAIEQTYEGVRHIEDNGELATYIPELANVDPDRFGVHISTLDGFEFGIGDYEDRFSIQSISKVLSL